MALTPSIDELGDIIRKQGERIAELERRTTQNATISGGSLTITSGGSQRLIAPDGTVLFYVGALATTRPDGSKQQGYIFRREGGALVFAVYNSSGSTNQFWAFYDAAGNVILSDDATSGQGIARPYIPITVHTSRRSSYEITTSATDELMFEAHTVKQQPKMTARVVAGIDTGTTGTWTLLVNDVVIATAPITSALAPVLVGPVAVDGAHMAALKIELKARRDSGLGNVYVQLMDLSGRQS